MFTLFYRLFKNCFKIERNASAETNDTDARVHSANNFDTDAPFANVPPEQENENVIIRFKHVLKKTNFIFFF